MGTADRPLIALVYDASAESGGGHRVRTEALAQALVEKVGGRAQACSIEQLAEVAPDLVLADLYRPKSLHGLRGPWLLVCLDDESELEFDCDLLINPNLNEEFTHRTSARTRYLRGGEYLLLRTQFQGQGAHPIQKTLEKLLLCFGGSDPADLMARMAEWLSPSEFEITAVLGGLRSHWPVLPASWCVQRDVANMAVLMREADLGIFAAGTLLYEAAACGLPSLVVSVTEAQAREARAAVRTNAVFDLGPGASLTRDALLAALSRYRDRSLRQVLSMNAQRLVDPIGCRRIIGEIAALWGR